MSWFRPLVRDGSTAKKFGNIVELDRYAKAHCERGFDVHDHFSFRWTEKLIPSNFVVVHLDEYGNELTRPPSYCEKQEGGDSPKDLSSSAGLSASSSTSSGGCCSEGEEPPEGRGAEGTLAAPAAGSPSVRG